MCPAIVVNNLSFALNGNDVSYRFHIDETSGDLISDHFGGSVTENPFFNDGGVHGGWSTEERHRREFPDLGRGDFRSPAVKIRSAQGHTVTSFKYVSHSVTKGKPELPGLPSTLALMRKFRQL